MVTEQTSYNRLIPKAKKSCRDYEEILKKRGQEVNEDMLVQAALLLEEAKMYKKKFDYLEILDETYVFMMETNQIYKESSKLEDYMIREILIEEVRQSLRYKKAEIEDGEDSDELFALREAAGIAEELTGQSFSEKTIREVLENEKKAKQRK